MTYVLLIGNREFEFKTKKEMNNRIKEIEKVLKALDLISQDDKCIAKKMI